MITLFQNSTFVFFGFLALVILVPCIAHYWSEVRIKEAELSLKQSMIDRGMSADEIAQVLKASSDKA